MSEVKTQTTWRAVNAQWINSDPDQDTALITLQSEGDLYAVACSGPKNMGPNDIISAMRVATATLINAAGGDMGDVGVVGVGSLDISQLDTGDQRAN